MFFQLPPAQLENALNKTAALKAPLVAHASQPNIRSTLPRLWDNYGIFIVVSFLLIMLIRQTFFLFQGCIDCSRDYLRYSKYKPGAIKSG